MPNKDGKGPNGKGSMTGRGLGNCTKSNPIKKPLKGFGLGRGPKDGSGRKGK